MPSRRIFRAKKLGIFGEDADETRSRNVKPSRRGKGGERTLTKQTNGTQKAALGVIGCWKNNRLKFYIVMVGVYAR